MRWHLVWSDTVAGQQHSNSRWPLDPLVALCYVAKASRLALRLKCEEIQRFARTGPHTHTHTLTQTVGLQLRDSSAGQLVLLPAPCRVAGCPFNSRCVKIQRFTNTGHDPREDQEWHKGSLFILIFSSSPACQPPTCPINAVSSLLIVEQSSQYCSRLTYV